MSNQPDLGAYFARIAIQRPSAPDLAALTAIVAAHARAISFENVDVFLGRGVSIDPAEIERKLVHERRGGYCFEQNALLLEVLRALGFDARPISARVRFQVPRDETTRRTHLFVRVELDGRSWLVDVGVGSLTPTAPLELVLETPQENSHDTRRIVAEGTWSGFESRGPDGRLFHQACLDGKWSDVCEFTLEEMPQVDRELANYFTSTHPDSTFRQELIAARVTDEGRVALRNTELKHRDLNGVATSTEIESAEELIRVLETDFRLHLSSEVRAAITAARIYGS